MKRWGAYIDIVSVYYYRCEFRLGVVPRGEEGGGLLGEWGVPPFARESADGEVRLVGEKGGIRLFCLPRNRYGMSWAGLCADLRAEKDRWQKVAVTRVK